MNMQQKSIEMIFFYKFRNAHLIFMLLLNFHKIFRDTVLVTVSAGGLGLAAVDLATNLFNAKVYFLNLQDFLCI